LAVGVVVVVVVEGVVVVPSRTAGSAMAPILEGE
jgi:hypothetical protein